MAEHLDVLVSVFGSVIAAGVTALISYVATREKVMQLEEKLKGLHEESKEDRRSIRLELESFVTHSYLSAVLEPIKKTLDTVEADIKEILKAVSKP